MKPTCRQVGIKGNENVIASLSFKPDKVSRGSLLYRHCEQSVRTAWQSQRRDSSLRSE